MWNVKPFAFCYLLIGPLVGLSTVVEGTSNLVGLVERPLALRGSYNDTLLQKDNDAYMMQRRHLIDSYSSTPWEKWGGDVNGNLIASSTFRVHTPSLLV